MFQLITKLEKKFVKHRIYGVTVMTCNKHNHEEFDDDHHNASHHAESATYRFVTAAPDTWRYLLGTFEPNLSVYVEWSCKFMLGNRNDINTEDR